MAILNDFKYYKPQEINETLQLLSEFKENAKILAGGTDLIVHLKEDLVKTENVIDIKGITQFALGCEATYIYITPKIPK